MTKREKTKICIRCKIEKSVSEFYKRNDSQSVKFSSRCIACMRECTKFTHKRKSGIVDGRFVARAKIISVIPRIESGEIIGEDVVAFLKEIVIDIDLGVSDIIKRFWGKVDKSSGEDGCWIWIGNKTAAGYGIFAIRGKNYSPHRFSYMLEYGEIPDGNVICHRCDNPSCCNPRHLFCGTTQDNVNDKIAKGRFPKENPRIRGRKNGARILNYAVAQEIRNRYTSGDYTQASLADEYRVSAKTVTDILKFKTWKNIS